MPEKKMQNFYMKLLQSEPTKWYKNPEYSHYFPSITRQITFEDFLLDKFISFYDWSHYYRMGGPVQAVKEVTPTMTSKFRLIAKQWYDRGDDGYYLIDNAEYYLERVRSAAIATYRMQSEGIPFVQRTGVEFVHVDVPAEDNAGSDSKSDTFTFLYSVIPWFRLK